jgi:hypothetical protein
MSNASVMERERSMAVQYAARCRFYVNRLNDLSLSNRSFEWFVV